MPATWPNPAGAYRNAAWSSAGSGGGQIVLDTVDSAYPYTNLSSGAIVMNRSGTVTINAQAGLTGFSITIQLRVNGSTVATGSSGTTSSITPYTYVAKTGDSITLFETDSVASTSGLTGSTNTFIHVTPAGTRTAPYNAVQVLNRAALY